MTTTGIQRPQNRGVGGSSPPLAIRLRLGASQKLLNLVAPANLGHQGPRRGGARRIADR